METKVIDLWRGVSGCPFFPTIPDFLLESYTHPMDLELDFTLHLAPTRRNDVIWAKAHWLLLLYFNYYTKIATNMNKLIQIKTFIEKFNNPTQKSMSAPLPLN